MHTRGHSRKSHDSWARMLVIGPGHRDWMSSNWDPGDGQVPYRLRVKQGELYSARLGGRGRARREQSVLPFARLPATSALNLMSTTPFATRTWRHVEHGDDAGSVNGALDAGQLSDPSSCSQANVPSRHPEFLAMLGDARFPGQRLVVTTRSVASTAHSMHCARNGHHMPGMRRPDNPFARWLAPKSGRPGEQLRVPDYVRIFYNSAEGRGQAAAIFEYRLRERLLRPVEQLQQQEEQSQDSLNPVLTAQVRPTLSMGMVRPGACFTPSPRLI